MTTQDDRQTRTARQVAAAMSTAHTFEAAYRGADKRTLQRVCTRPFFDGCLAAADLRLVRLPEPGPGLDGFDVKLEENTATFVVPAGGEVLKISMTQQKQEELHAAPRFLVAEVTIYDLNSTQDKRLSSLFTAHATMESLVPASIRVRMHVGLIRLGRLICHPRRPSCEVCPLFDLCPTGPSFVGQA